MSDEPERSVQLSIAAHPRMLRFARVVAATLAVELEFTLDEIEDLRVAVDELAAAAIEGADGAATLDLWFQIRDADLVVDGEVQGELDATELHPVAQELINMLANSYEFTTRDGKRVFRLVKHRSTDT